MAAGIGSLIGGALQVAQTIGGGIAQKRAAKRQNQRINDQMQANEDWYNRRYNEDVTQRADAQRLITLTQEAMRRNNRAAAGTSAVMGGTTESVAAAKAANNQAMGDTISQIAADAASRKDAVEQQYMANRESYVDALNNVDNQRMRNIAQSVKNANGVAGEIGGNIDDYIAKKK